MNVFVLVITVFMILTLTACVTERVVVVEKEVEKKTDKEDAETFTRIVESVAMRDFSYKGETVTIRATVDFAETDYDGSIIIGLKTGNPNVGFRVIVPPNWSPVINYRENIAYTFTVRISHIGGWGVNSTVVKKKDK